MSTSLPPPDFPRLGDPTGRRWIKQIRGAAKLIDPYYFDDFEPATDAQLDFAERSIGRPLPNDYRRFMREIGGGRFPFGGGFDTVEELSLSPCAPVYFWTGSAGMGVTDEEHLRLYRSWGSDNPRPDLFNLDSLIHHGVNLLDLVQIGSNGGCCYYQLHAGRPPRPFGFALMTNTEEFEETADSFAEGLRSMLLLHLFESLEWFDE